MASFRKYASHALLVGAVLLYAASALGQQQSKPAPQHAAATKTAADADQYVGSDTCITCHEDEGKRFNKTTMGKISEK